MTKDYRLVIDDMLESIRAIQSYAEGVDEVSFSQNLLLQDAIIRRLGIIGEAARKLPDDVRQLAPAIPWKSVIGFRNIVIHDYANIAMDQAWDIVIHDLPPLVERLTTLRSKLPDVQPPKEGV